MGGNYKIRKYTSQDQRGVFSLIEVVWGKKISETLEKVWEWKIEKPSSYWSKENITILLESEETIVGLIAFLAFPLKVQDKLLTAYWGCDFVIHPKHRGKGASLLRHAMKEKTVIAGTGNELSYGLCMKYGWIDLFHITNMIYIIHFDKIFPMKADIKILNIAIRSIWNGIRRLFFPFYRTSLTDGLSIKKISIFDDRIDEFWRDAAKDHEIITVRNKQYLNWRFTERPDRTYEIYLALQEERIQGYIVFYCETIDNLKFGHIVDLFVKGGAKKALNILIMKSVTELELENVDLITCYTSPYNLFYKKELKKNGFVFKKTKAKLFAYTNSEDIPAEILSHPEKWFITRADSDLEMN